MAAINLLTMLLACLHGIWDSMCMQLTQGFLLVLVNEMQ